ncbi:hypothetical protein EB73_38825 [Mycobacterium sp. SWH-M3]|nr:hypothetical protein EB73_38825 [Mycobacterium sp. SWH-M3]
MHQTRTVCRHHGGVAPQVLAKTREAMQLAAYHNYLNEQALADSAESEQVRLNAIRDLQDRAGLAAKHAVELSTKPPEPWEEVMSDVMQDPVARVSRAEHLAARGEPPPTALPLADLAIVDAEIVEDDTPRTPSSTAGHAEAADRGDDPTTRPAWATDAPTPPGRGLMTIEEANAEANRINRKAGVMPPAKRRRNR